MSSSTPRADPSFEALLDYLKRSRGFDFTGYKRSTLMRRVEKRMKTVEVEDYAAYVDYLEVHPDEFSHLFNTILINVTGFFRDPDAWESLRALVQQRLLEREGGEPIRVWSAGCASGEETYTLVMLLAEALGVDGFRERVKVYATDVDDAALAEARAASYDADDLAGLPAGLKERYFEQVAGRFVFRGDLRRYVIFGRHDLVQDAPISHLDLLVCRNTLMYFNTEIQARILGRFHFALNPTGLLFLGKAEMMRSHASMFGPVDLKARVFAKLPRSGFRDRLLMGAPGQGDGAGARMSFQVRLREAALNADPAAHLVVDLHGALALANDPARALFGIGDKDVGRPVQDLTLSYRPVELRSRIEQVTAERRAVYLSCVEHVTATGEARCYDVHVTPLLDAGMLLGVSVAFVDVTRSQRLQTELEGANQELETAYEELQSTNEELETTNEELQSTIEELETTNEELQSTNEELETMNEELQSTNEELETINDELRRRTDDLNTVNAYMSSILASLRLGVVVLDREMSVRVWNPRAEDLWGLRQDEVESQSLFALDIGLPVERLKAPIRACLERRDDHQDVVLDAINRRGRPIRCHVSAAPLLGPDRTMRGVVLLMDDRTDGAQA
jgi:two-component system CheB/CheR fusion protein